MTRPNGDHHFEIPPGTLEESLRRDFNAWLHDTLPKPSRATGVVLEYLRYGGPTLFVRGSQRAGMSAPEFYVQVSFSGCAGEAEVSASVAAHWAACWYRARGPEIGAAHLLPFGFTPAAENGSEKPTLFVPAGDCGYLEVASPEQQARYSIPAFSLDHALAEAYSGDPRLQSLEERIRQLPVGSGCRCQVCDRDLGDLM